MKLRIAIWAAVGAVVMVLWSLYISTTSPIQHVWMLVYLTCPIALAHRYALSFYFVLLANVATYALIGTIFEAMRRHHKQANLISN